MIIKTADGTRIEILPPCAHPHPCRPEEGFVPEECSVAEEECRLKMNLISPDMGRRAADPGGG